jgi:hypothetical protein
MPIYSPSDRLRFGNLLERGNLTSLTSADVTTLSNMKSVMFGKVNIDNPIVLKSSRCPVDPNVVRRVRVSSSSPASEVDNTPEKSITKTHITIDSDDSLMEAQII